MPPTPKPNKLQILHAYRTLLRSTTYLPDSLSRIRIHNEIVARFRKSCRKPATLETLSALRSYQTKLQRASALYAKELESVLQLTYGRKGPRRRVLVDALRCSTTEVGGEVEGEGELPDDMSLQGFIDVLEKEPGVKKEGRKVWEQEKFQALLKSQKENISGSFEKCRVKDLKPQIAKENIWGRNTPVKVQRNVEKTWLAKTLKKVAPPVEGSEWERLRDLASGELVEGPALRRARKDVVADREEGFEWEDVMGKIKGEGGTEGKILSRRGLRRLYGIIWAQTPKMTWDSERNNWVTEWGREGPVTKSGLVTIPVARGSEMELFEGVEHLVGKMEKGGKGRGKKGKNPERIIERVLNVN